MCSDFVCHCSSRRSQARTSICNVFLPQECLPCANSFSKATASSEVTDFVTLTPCQISANQVTDQCRFEHSRGGGSGPPPGPRGNQPRNSFEPLENRISSFGGGGRGNNQALSRGGGHGQAFGGGGRGGRGDHYGSNRGNLFSSGRGDYRGSGRGGFRSRGGGGQFSRNNQSDTPK